MKWINFYWQKMSNFSRIQKCQIWHENQRSNHNQILLRLNSDISTYHNKQFIRFSICFSKKSNARYVKKSPAGIHLNHVKITETILSSGWFGAPSTRPSAAACAAAYQSVFIRNGPAICSMYMYVYIHIFQTSA